MKFKKFLAGSLSVLLLVSTPGAFAAYTESSFNEETRNYIYKNSYDKNMEKENLGYDMELVSDPTNTENKVLHVYDSDGKGGADGSQSAFATGPVTNGWLYTPTYEEKGIDGTKKTYIASDIYLPSALLKELGTENTLYAGINPENGVWTVNRQVGIAITKTSDRDTFTLTGKTGKTIEVQPDQWFNLRMEVQVGQGPVSFYINNKHFDDGTIAGWLHKDEYWSVKHACNGILFRSKMVMITGFYLDNSVIYELKDQNYVVSISDGQTGVEPDHKFTLTFDIPVSASDYVGKITAVSGENTYTAAVTQESEKVLAFTFDSLSGQTQYTLNIESVTKGEASFPKKTLPFTTGKGRRNDEIKVLYSYTDEEKPTMYLYDKTTDGVANATFKVIADPTGRSSKVVQYTANGKTGYITWKSGETAAGLSNNNKWGEKKYGACGMTDTKTVFLTSDVYLPKAALEELTESSKLVIQFGGCGTLADTYGAGTTYIGKSADGTKYTLTAGGKTMELSADQWFTYKVEVMPNSRKSDVYINGVYFATVDGGDNQYVVINTGVVDSGMRIVSNKGMVVKSILLDNVKYWQMEKDIAVDEIRTDASEGKIYVDMSTNVDENEISKLCLKHNGTDVSDLITNRAVDKYGYTIILDVDFSKLALMSEYTIEVPFGYKDANGQSAISSVSRAFTTPKSTDVYMADSNVTVEPSQQGMKASVTLNNVAAAKDVWVVAAVFGEYNQMLAVDEKSVNVAGQTEVSFLSDDDCGGAKEMRIFIWDSKDTMKVVQKSEIIWRASGE